MVIHGTAGDQEGGVGKDVLAESCGQNAGAQLLGDLPAKVACATFTALGKISPAEAKHTSLHATKSPTKSETTVVSEAANLGRKGRYAGAAWVQLFARADS